MAIQGSGQVSLNDLHVEAGGTSGTECSFNDSDIRGLISKGAAAQMRMDEWYGASNVFTFNITSNTVHANLNTLATNAGWNGSAPIECTINSGVWCYATSTGNYGLLVNVANATIYNNGYIVGKGGNGGNRNQNGSGGGHALRVTVSGVTIQNNSGAFIAGGGGGGGGSSYTGGGGGAGGGTAGTGNTGNGQRSGGYTGSTGAGGHGQGGANGGGVAGGDGNWAYGFGGKGGGSVLSTSTNVRAGGGGWGQSGLSGTTVNPRSGGGAGRAISKTTSITLSNSGKIYGAT